MPKTVIGILNCAYIFFSYFVSKALTVSVVRILRNYHTIVTKLVSRTSCFASNVKFVRMRHHAICKDFYLVIDSEFIG